MSLEHLFLAIGAGIAAASLTEAQAAAFRKPIIDLVGEWIPDTPFTRDAGGWTPPKAAEPYLPLLYAAEQRHSLPHNLLVRVAYQESRFREDIITGEVTSSAGALGMMQIVPRWHPNVDPLNVPEAIDYAAGYLARLRTLAGSWEMALAAYNWGIGNLTNYGFDEAPRETREYVAQIAGDVLRA